MEIYTLENERDDLVLEVELLRKEVELLRKENEILQCENERLRKKNNDLVKQLGSKVILDYGKGI